MTIVKYRVHHRSSDKMMNDHDGGSGSSRHDGVSGSTRRRNNYSTDSSNHSSLGGSLSEPCATTMRLVDDLSIVTAHSLVVEDHPESLSSEFDHHHHSQRKSSFLSKMFKFKSHHKSRQNKHDDKASAAKSLTLSSVDRPSVLSLREIGHMAGSKTSFADSLNNNMSTKQEDDNVCVVQPKLTKGNCGNNVLVGGNVAEETLRWMMILIVCFPFSLQPKTVWKSRLFKLLWASKGPTI